MKFEIGEIVIYAGDGRTDDGEPSEFSFGEEIRIEERFPAGQRFNDGDEIYFSDENVYVCDGVYLVESNLRKRRPPEQPSAFSYDEIISMCNGTDIRPTETQVRQGLKGILEPFGSGEG